METLSGGTEIFVSGGGKVFGSASLSFKDNSIAGAKLKDNTISEGKLESTLAR